MGGVTYDPKRDVVRPLPQRDFRNTLSEEGARQLAQELNDWWHSRGFTNVEHWIETVSVWGMRKKQHPAILDAPPDVSHLARNWAVRSNLVNGLPPKSHQTR